MLCTLGMHCNKIVGGHDCKVGQEREDVLMSINVAYSAGAHAYTGMTRVLTEFEI